MPGGRLKRPPRAAKRAVRPRSAQNRRFTPTVETSRGASAGACGASPVRPAGTERASGGGGYVLVKGSTVGGHPRQCKRREAPALALGGRVDRPTRWYGRGFLRWRVWSP